MPNANNYNRRIPMNSLSKANRLLPRRNQFSLLSCVWFPSTSKSLLAPMSLGIVLHACLQFRSEMSNETLNGPCESLAESCFMLVQTHKDVPDSCLPQIVCPSTCFVNSCNISISRSRPCPFSNLFIICSVHLLPSLQGVH